MQYRFDHIDRLQPRRDLGDHPVDLPDLHRAELDTVKTLCVEAAESEQSHVDASMIIRSEDGIPVSVVCVHASVKRL